MFLQQFSTFILTVFKQTNDQKILTLKSQDAKAIKVFYHQLSKAKFRIDNPNSN